MISMTPAAAHKAAALLAVSGDDTMSLRIGVQAGGCAGLRYQLFFDDRALDGDLDATFDTDAGTLRVVIDKMSAPYLDGATVDYVDTLDRAGFVFDNPNASGSCACNASFH